MAAIWPLSQGINSNGYSSKRSPWDIKETSKTYRMTSGFLHLVLSKIHINCSWKNLRQASNFGGMYQALQTKDHLSSVRHRSKDIYCQISNISGTKSQNF